MARNARPGGSSRTTRRPAARPARRPSTAPRPVTRSRPRPLRRLVILGVMVAFLSVILAPTVRAYVHQRSEISALKEQVAQQKTSVAGLQRQTQQWKDPAYIEHQARERLKFVKPGEKSYTVIEGTKPSTDAPVVTGIAAVPQDVQRTRPWYGEVWESMAIADAGVPAAVKPPAAPPRPTAGKTAPPAVTDTAPQK